MPLPAFSALPSTESVTSYSFSAILLPLTLMWILIAGCCFCGASEAGAFGFSNDRSLVYCASTFNWGGGAASGGAPLRLVMEVSPGACGTDFASESAREVRKCRCRASGYHSPASFHKDDNRARPAKTHPKDRFGAPDTEMKAGLARRVHAKLLIMRDFQASSGFPSQRKRATIRWCQSGKIICSRYFHRLALSCQKVPFGRAP